MIRFNTLLIILLTSKVFFCQNYVSYNSTPLYSWQGNVENFCSDSLDNKYVFDYITGSYSSSKFSYSTFSSGSTFLLIKYDSLNNIKFYKSIWTDIAKEQKLIYYNNCIYIIFNSLSQYSYDNNIYSSNNNFVILKINPTNGNIISSFATPNLAGSTLTNAFIINNKIHLFLKTPNSSTYNGTNISTGNFYAGYSTNGNFLFAKNLPAFIRLNGILEKDNQNYLSGCIDTLITTQRLHGFIYKFDSSYNILNTFFSGTEIFNLLELNKCILFTTDIGDDVLNINDQNKLFLSIIDTNLKIIKESKWGLKSSYYSEYYFTKNYRKNCFSHLNLINNKILFCFTSALSLDSSLGCIAKGKTSTNIFLYTLDTLFNCINYVQINNGNQYLDNLGNQSGKYFSFTDPLHFTSGKQISALITSWNESFEYPNLLFQFYLNNHKYPLLEMPRGNNDNNSSSYLRRPNIVSLYFNNWIETFYPNKFQYCNGDSLKLTYKKFGSWSGSTIFRVEANVDPNFPTNTTVLFGSFKDSIASEGNALIAAVKIPNIGGGQFYLRIKSINPSRISNIADTFIIISPLPPVYAGKDVDICFGDTGRLYGNNFSNSFYWTSSRSNILSDTLSLNPKVLSTDSVYCVLHTLNVKGCENTDTVYINVIPKIALKYKIDSLNPKCINSELQVSLTTNYNDSIRISWGDGMDTIIKTNSHILTHRYSVLGAKTISIKAIANKCMDSTGFSFIVRSPIQLTAANDTILCKGRWLSIWARASGGDSLFSYILKAPGISLQNTSGFFLVVPDSSTTFCIGAINACANDTQWKQIRVSLRLPLSLKLNTIDTTLCKGSGLVIQSTATGGISSGYNYTLKKNGSIQQSNTTGSFIIIANVNEIYTVVLNDNCTELNDSVNLNIKIFTPLQFNQTIPDIYTCPGDSVILKANTTNGSGVVSYEWIDGTGTILSTAYALRLIPNASDRFILKVTDACTSIYDTAWIYAFASSAGNQLLSDLQSGCAPLTINFETPTLNFSNSQPCEALWDFGEGNTLSQNFTNTASTLKAKHIYTNPGIYDVKLELKFKNNTKVCNILTTVIEVLIIPRLHLVVTPKKITLPKTQCTATITTTNSDSVVISWGDGLSDNFSTANPSFIAQTHDYSDTGHYIVKAIAYNKNTCYTEASAPVYHADSFSCFIPNAFSPNKDALNETFKPVISFCKSYELKIFNRWGELVYTSTYIKGRTQPYGWTGEENVSGTYLYLLNALDGDNQYHSLKGTVMVVR